MICCFYTLGLADSKKFHHVCKFIFAIIFAIMLTCNFFARNQQKHHLAVESWSFKEAATFGSRSTEEFCATRGILRAPFYFSNGCIYFLSSLHISLGWRWLLALSALPSLCFVLASSWLPESARYMAASGNSDQALDTLSRVAEQNGKSMLLGRLVVDDTMGITR